MLRQAWASSVVDGETEAEPGLTGFMPPERSGALEETQLAVISSSPLVQTDPEKKSISPAWDQADSVHFPLRGLPEEPHCPQELERLSWVLCGWFRGLP